MKISRRKLEVGVPAVAMADIAFNLVLFFIMMARAQDDSHLMWEPAQVPEAGTKVDQAPVTVTVDKDSKIYLNGHHVSVSELAAKVEKLLANEPPGKRTVLLKIDKDTQASTFEPLIEAVSQAGGELVHVLAKDKPEQ